MTPPLCDDVSEVRTLAIASSAPETGIIVLSGFAAERMREPALRNGADLYLEKGLPLDEVISAVREVSSRAAPPARPAR